MKKRDIKNFYLVIGDIALNKTSRENHPFIEAAFTKDDRRALFTYPSISYFCGDFSEDEIIYAGNEIKRNISLLKGQK